MLSEAPAELKTDGSSSLGVDVLNGEAGNYGYDADGNRNWGFNSGWLNEVNVSLAQNFFDNKREQNVEVVNREVADLLNQPTSEDVRREIFPTKEESDAFEKARADLDSEDPDKRKAAND